MPSNFRVVEITWMAAACLVATVWAEGPGQTVKQHAFEKDIQAFEAQDKEHPPRPGQVVFVGSSSIRFWDLKKSFPTIGAINRGFGGSQTSDAVYFAKRIVTPYKPRQVVFYSGDNDLNAGKSPEQVAQDVQAFVKTVREELPDVPIILIAIKPSPQRIKILEKQKIANQLIQNFAAAQKGVAFADVASAMLDEEGKPLADIFRDDRLHLNESGYKIWNGILEKLLSPSAEPK